MRQNLREKIEKYREEIYHINKSPDKEDICRSIGFQDAVNLLWPAIEAHIKNADQDYRGNREQASVNSFNVLKDLEEKLK